MLKTRLIPVLLLKDGELIRSEKFSIHQFIGNPYHEVMRYNEWSVDELIYIDISQSDDYDRGRHDTVVKHVKSVLGLMPVISKTCFVPLTFGGRIRTIDHIRERLALGADKVTVNTMALASPDFITESANAFGNQCIVVCIDYRIHADGSVEVFTEGASKPTGRDPADWAEEAEARGAGEVLLQAVDRDGTAEGYDIKTISRVVSSVNIPVIALGGAGSYQHFAEVASQTGVSAVAAANLFHFKELSDRYAKREMKKKGIPVREV